MKDESTDPVVSATEMPADVLKQASALFSRLPVLGHVVWLFMNSSAHRHVFMSDLEWRVLPPFMLGQCRLYMKGDVPLGYISWAHVPDKVEKRLLSGEMRLSPDEWKGDGHVWIFDVVAPFGGVSEMIEELRNTELRGMPVRQLVPKKGGGFQAVEWPAIDGEEE